VRNPVLNTGLSLALKLAFTVDESFSILALPELELDPNFMLQTLLFSSHWTTK